MNTENLISLFQDPAQLNSVSLEQLNEILEVYPFFNQARLLYTKKMQQSQHLLLKKEIQKTAIAVNDRKALYEFLYKKEIQETIKEIESQDCMETSESTTEDSSFSKPVEIEPTKQPESEFKKPIDLSSLGTEDSKQMDILEKQIIGQTIEHVLTLEIKQNKQEKVKKESDAPAPLDSQKFSDWLTILDQDRLKNWRAKEKVETEDNVPSEKSIIDSFLAKDTNVINPTNDDIEYTPSNLARLSIVDDEDFVTETLAKIYWKQGNVQKALNAYQKLLLKYPEKKTYFAAQIQKIEKDLK